MRDVFYIEGSMPSLNEYVSAERANRFKAAKIKRQETERVRLAAVNQSVQHFVGPVIVRFLWVESTRRRDLDNIAFAKKFVLDGLVAAGVLDGDSQRYVVGLQDTFEIDPHYPRVVVENREV